MWAGLLSNDAIIAMVGHEAFARGLVYARNGHVYDVRLDAVQARVDGWVAGSDRRRYAVRVVLSERGEVAHRASCTCPVARDCKHAAAVLIAARAGLGADAGAARPEWESVVARLVREAPAELREPAEARLELALDQGRAFGGFRSSARLLARAVRRGARGGWVASGVSWSDLDYPSDVLPPQVRDLLLQFRAAAGSGARYASPRSAWLTLDEVSTTFWPLLDIAARIGLTVLTERSGSVVVLPDRVAVRLDLRAATGDGLTAEVALPDEPWAPADLFAGPGLGDAAIGLLGDPAHGLCWLAAPPSPGGGPDLVLARLDRALPAELRRLVRRRSTLHIPSADRTRFLADFLPALRRAVPVVSGDATVVLPPVPVPELVLTLRFRPRHLVRLDWAIRYQHLGIRHDFELDAPAASAVGAPAGLRDLVAERDLLADLPLPYDELPQLADPGSADRPAAHALLGDTAAARFVHEVLPRLRERGVVVETEGEPIDYRPADHDPEVEVATAATEASDWFDLHIQVRVDDEVVLFEDLFLALNQGQDCLILDTGVYVPLNTPVFDRLRELIEEARSLQDRDRPQLRISRFQTALWDELTEVAAAVRQADQWQRAVAALPAALDQAAAETPVPLGLRAELRPYQRAGYGWLASLWRHRLGGILADDMGLGKTLQTLAMITYAREQEPGAPPFLIVAPTSVVTTWAQEAARFAPGLAVRVVRGARAGQRAPVAEQIEGADLVVTSYARLRIDQAGYRDRAWSGLVLDEAQFVKNHRAKTHQAARLVVARMRLAITGTPVENSLLDLWSMLSLTAPGLFPSAERFTEYYQRPIERDGDVVRLARLRRRIAPLVLRRTKDQVAAELPAKQEQVLVVPLQARHARVYQTHLQRERQKVLGLIEDLDGNRFSILRSLTLLRQLALDPALVDDEHPGVLASKTETLVELLAEVTGEGHRALVFSQFTGYLRRVRHRLTQAGLTTSYLDGSTTERQQVIDRFRGGESAVFLISLRAGGFGLNLTEADYCFVLDPWWNPAVEEQAVDRAHRLGQTRSVMVYRLVAEGTIEEKVMALKERKRALFDTVLGGDSLSSAAFGDAEIRELLGLDRAVLT